MTVRPHFVHVDADDAPGCTDLPRREEDIKSSTGSQVDNRLALASVSDTRSTEI